MKFSAQYVNRYDYPTSGYKIIGVLLLDEKTKQFFPVAVDEVEGGDWARQIQADIALTGVGPLAFQTQLVDQNGVTTAYSVPFNIAGATPEDAADKAMVRNAAK